MEQLLRGDALRETLIWCYGDGTVREQFSRENHWETRGNHWNSQGSRKGEKKLSGLPFVCDVPFAQPLSANKDIYIYCQFRGYDVFRCAVTCFLDIAVQALSEPYENEATSVPGR